MSKKVDAPAASESSYIAAMSREGVVSAYEAWDALSPAEEELISRLPEDAFAHILDLGCGAGRLARRLAPRASSYLGVDASEHMIDAARRNVPDARFEVGDMVSYSVLAAHYSLVLIMHNALDNLSPVSRRGAALTNSRSALTLGGSLIVSSHTTHGSQPRGYYQEPYHGTQVTTFRTALSDFVAEVEAARFRVEAALRDYRDARSDWTYVLATAVS